MSSLQTYQQFVSLLFRVADARARYADLDAILDFVRDVIAKTEDLDSRFCALSEEFSHLTTNLLSRELEYREIKIPPQEPQPLTQIHIIELKAPVSAPSELTVIKEPVVTPNVSPASSATSSAASVSAPVGAEGEEEAAENAEGDGDGEGEGEGEGEEETAEGAEGEEETAEGAEGEEETAEGAEGEDGEEGEATEETEETPAQEEDAGEAVEEGEEAPEEEEDAGEAEEAEEPPITYIYLENKRKARFLVHPITHQVYEYNGENTPGAYLNCKYIAGKVVKDE